MGQLVDEVNRVASESGFSGVVRIDLAGEVAVEAAYGYADRGHRIPNAVETRFGIASGTKALTALTVVSLVAEGRLELATSARSLLGKDLPLIGDDVTVEHLLAHRSGIGDYLDEDDPAYDVTGYVLPVPVHELATTEQYLRVLDGFPAVFRPDERFAYCNGGYVILALLAERATAMPFHELVEQRVCAPAGMRDTAFSRSDEPDGRMALGYLDDGPRTNVLHLPVRGSGDGGAYTTPADVHALWSALFAGAIVPSDWVAEMVRPRSDVPEESLRYGLGFWLHAYSDVAMLVGGDAGVSFRSVHDPTADLTHTVVSNTSAGAWPLSRHLHKTLTN